MENLERRLYDLELFDRVSGAVVEETSRYLGSCRTAPYPSLKPTPPAELVRRMSELLDRRPEKNDAASLGAHARELVRTLLDGTNPLQSPHYLGHQVPPPVPFSAAFALPLAVANPGTAVFEMAPSGIAAEKALSERLGRYLGWGSGFDSIVTSGGSLANLTAVLAARNTRYPDFWKNGAVGLARRPAILTSEDAHYSISRAAGAAGLGASSVIKIGLDSRRRMDPALLEAAFEKATREGYEPFCVVASSCSTPVGAFDPIEPIAEFASRRGLWLHVDAAHGGGLLLSRRHRGLLSRIERADSVTWDAHKMMFVPSLCTFVFYREAVRSYAPFAQDAPYLFKAELDHHTRSAAEPRLDSAAFDPGLRTLECTRPAQAITLWALWSTFGPEAIEALVDRVISQARLFHALLEESPDFEPVTEPECNIVCFRHLPERLRSAAPERVSAFQLELRQRLLATGRFFITGTTLDGVYALRTTIMNASTGEAELRALLDELRRLGREL
jgi:L-2,4-diaminobutyrate decarboxylase